MHALLCAHVHAKFLETQVRNYTWHNFAWKENGKPKLSLVDESRLWN